ncbi:MAG: efflux RND transporter periplasmic adaptor subunit [Caldilineaceae bacterium]|nr:efflux RND transporter periplasmic adaptor subunit [Caldilineaceae bacterium]
MTNRWLVVLGIVIVAGLGYGSYQLGFWPSDLLPVMAEPRLQVAPGLEDARPTAHAARQVRAEASVVPVRSVELSMPVEGIVQDVFVQEGDLVAAGQLLVKLRDNRQRVLVTQAQAQLNRAQAALALLAAGPKPEEVAQMEAALAAAEANYAKLSGGLLPGAIAAAEAALGQAQAEYRVLTRGADPLELIEATAELELAQAQIDLASAAYNQVRGNPDIGMLPEALDLQEATAAYNAAQARYDLLQSGAAPDLAASAAAAIRVAQAQLDALQQAQPGEVAEAAALVQQAQAALDFVKSGARAEELAVAQGDVDIATALLQDALVALAETELRAPFTGTVTALAIDSGEQVAPNVPVIQLADLSRWQIETLDLTELDVGGIAPGDTVDLTFDALPSLALTGKVVRIRPVGETSSVEAASSLLPQRSAAVAEQQASGDIVYRVVIEPETHDARLLWNMTALVDFGSNSKPGRNP